MHFDKNRGEFRQFYLKMTKEKRMKEIIMALVGGMVILLLAGAIGVASAVMIATSEKGEVIEVKEKNNIFKIFLKEK